MDGGSTQSFIQPQLVTQLGLPCHNTTPLRVMVGNGQYLECHSVCEAITITIQDIPFSIYLYILPISGANIVLGVQWLKSLGPILTDYSTLCMQFIYEGRLVKLQGDHAANMSMLTSTQFRRLCKKQGPGLFFHIALVFAESLLPHIDTLPPPIQTLLVQFGAFFQPLHSPPPTRPTDHHIHLIPQSTPVNV